MKKSNAIFDTNILELDEEDEEPQTVESSFLTVSNI